jgi:hypothetical protein
MVPWDFLSLKKTTPNMAVTKLMAKICGCQIRLAGRCRGAYIVGVSEESDTSNDTGADMIPSERCLVDLSECESSSLVGVGDMGEVIVEVVEGGVASGGLVHGSGS